MSRFLIVRLGSLGDVVHAIPAAAALRARYPEARIDWMVDPRYVEVLGLVPSVDAAIPIDPRMFYGDGERKGLLPSLAALRRSGYDAAIDLQGLLKSAVLARAAGARQTIGFPRAHLREPFARLFYTTTADPGESTHVVFKNLAILAPLGVDDRQPRFPLVIPSTPTIESVAGRFGADHYGLLNPGAAWPNKRWPPARFGELALAIQRRFGLQSLVLWGPGEEAIAQAVVDSSSGAAEVSPKTSITDLFGIARGAHLMISGDTGPLHIAAAVGTPIVALFGPTWPQRNGPWDANDITLSRASQCSCLYERRCRRAEPCINDITVGEVMTAVERRLAVRV